MGISLKPSQAVTGGLIQDIDVKITNARFVVFDYEGKGKPCLAARITMEPVEGGDDIVQHYSAGSLERFAPSDDDSTPLTEVGEEGRFIVAAEGSTATQLSKSSNYSFFNQELANAGYPEDRMEDNISSIEGTVMHIIRKPAPKREGLVSDAPANGAPVREKTVLVASKVLAFPWDGKKGTKAKGATAAAGSKAGGSDVNSTTVALLQELLAKNGGSITPTEAKRSGFPLLLNKSRGVSVADRNTILANVVSADWLTANQGETSFGFDGDNIVAVA